MTAPELANRQHPDLRQLIFDTANEILGRDDALAEMKLREPLSPERVTIECQRTWSEVRTANPVLDGGDFSACVAFIHDWDTTFSWFVLAARRKQDPEWTLFRSQGGTPVVDGSPPPGIRPPG